MQFKLVLLGTILLVIGLVAYTAIPNIHRTPVFQATPLPSLTPLTVPASGATQIARNLTLVQGGQNQLQINITVTSTPPQPSTLVVKVFQGNNTRSCLDPQKSYLVNQEVSNATLQTPVNNSGLYCFNFENLDSQNPKTVTMTASVNSNFVQVQVTNDGGMNLVGLGLAAFGFLVALVGFARKTVIPWE